MTRLRTFFSFYLFFKNRYWPLDEALGANHAENLGSEGPTLRARFSRAVRYRVPGFVRNDGPRHRPPVAIGFNEGSKAKIDLRAHESLCPMDVTTHFSVACWFRLDKFAPHKMVCVANGRYELYVSRDREICFSVYVTSKMVSISAISDPDVVKLDTWYFVVGTYDGGQLRLYLNGVVDTRRSFTEALRDAQDNLMAQTKARQRALRDEQLVEEQGAEDYARSEIMKQLQLPSGQREMIRAAKKLMQENNLKISISKKSEEELREQGIVKISMNMAQERVKEGMISELASELLEKIRERYRQYVTLTLEREAREESLSFSFYLSISHYSPPLSLSFPSLIHTNSIQHQHQTNTGTTKISNFPNKE